jgi:surface polysaccharide O-acyltransferase-like enzyme
MEKKNIDWIDSLRVICVLAVITIHSLPYYLSSMDNLSKWHTANALNSLSRFCVPVFIMISGLLWFADPAPAKIFYKKRAIRLFLPFLFWSFSSYVFYKYYLKGSTDYSVMFLDFYEKFRNAQIYAHFWYIYMLVGLCLIAPVFKTWINHVSEAEIRLYLVIWLIVLFYQAPVLNNMRIQFDLKGIYNYSGYLVLGYYLGNYNSIPAQKQKRVGMMLYFSAILFTIMVTYFISMKDKIFKETYCEYLSLNVALAATGIFLWFKQLQVTRPVLKKGIQSIAKHSYGIYLSHFIFIDLLMEIRGPYYEHPIVYVPCIVTACLSLSWITIYLLSKVPYSKYFIG